MKRIVLFLILSALLLTACADDTPNGDIITKSELIEKQAYGELVFIKAGNDERTQNFKDDIFSYWFDENEKLLSRTLLVRSETAEYDDVASALEKATEDISKYTKEQDFTGEGWEVNIESNDDTGQQWLIKYIFKDKSEVITQRHTVVLGKSEDADIITLISERASEDAITVSRYMAEEKAIAAAEEKAGQNAEKGQISISECELFAEKGETLWSVTVNGIVTDENIISSYFVVINAVTGEVTQVEECK